MKIIGMSLKTKNANENFENFINQVLTIQAYVDFPYS